MKRQSLIVLFLIWSAALMASAAELPAALRSVVNATGGTFKAYDANTAIPAPNGYRVLERPSVKAKVLKEAAGPEEIVARGHFDTSDGRFYVSDWSWDRAVAGNSPNWIQISDGKAPGNASSGQRGADAGGGTSPYPGERFPATRLKSLADPDLAAMNAADVRYAINEMFARHGAYFPKEEIRQSFAGFTWYKPRDGVDLDAIEAEFSDIEKANLLALATRRAQLAGQPAPLAGPATERAPTTSAGPGGSGGLTIHPQPIRKEGDWYEIGRYRPPGGAIAVPDSRPMVLQAQTRPLRESAILSHASEPRETKADAMALNSDGGMLAVRFYQDLCVFDLRTRLLHSRHKAIDWYDRHQTSSLLRMSPHGRFVFSSVILYASGQTKVIDVSMGNTMSALTAALDERWVWDLQFSADERQAVVVQETDDFVLDRQVEKIWLETFDVADGKERERKELPRQIAFFGDDWFFGEVRLVTGPGGSFGIERLQGRHLSYEKREDRLSSANGAGSCRVQQPHPAWQVTPDVKVKPSTSQGSEWNVYGDHGAGLVNDCELFDVHYSCDQVAYVFQCYPQGRDNSEDHLAAGWVTVVLDFSGLVARRYDNMMLACAQGDRAVWFDAGNGQVVGSSLVEPNNVRWRVGGVRGLQGRSPTGRFSEWIAQDKTVLIVDTVSGRSARTSAEAGDLGFVSSRKHSQGVSSSGWASDERHVILRGPWVVDLSDDKWGRSTRLPETAENLAFATEQGIAYLDRREIEGANSFKIEARLQDESGRNHGGGSTVDFESGTSIWGFYVPSQVKWLAFATSGKLRECEPMIFDFANKSVKREFPKELSGTLWRGDATGGVVDEEGIVSIRTAGLGTLDFDMRTERVLSQGSYRWRHIWHKGKRIFEKSDIHSPRRGLYHKVRGEPFVTLESIDPVIAIDEKRNWIVTTGGLHDLRDGKLLCSLQVFADGGFTIMDTQGCFAGNDAGKRQVAVRTGGEVLALERFESQYYRPDRIRALLRGEGTAAGQMPAAPAASLATQGKAGGSVAFRKLPDGRTAAAEVIVDGENGAAEIRLYCNGAAVPADGLPEVRGGRISQRFRFQLVAGGNELKAVGVDVNGLESVQTIGSVSYAGERVRSRLHVLGVGLNDYKNPRYRLSYCRNDVEAVLKELAARSRGLFADIETSALYDADATRSGMEAAVASMGAKMRPEDVFVLVYAGHGTTGDDGSGRSSEFYLGLHGVTQMYGNRELLEREGMSGKRLQELVTALPARKRLLLFDACQSGAVAETFAMRGLGEEKALMQLARAAGTVVMASSRTEQYARELETLGHGVFSHALLAGLAGDGDRNRDGVLSVLELHGFLEERVPEVSQKYCGAEQFPVLSYYGQDFPISLSKQTNSRK